MWRCVAEPAESPPGGRPLRHPCSAVGSAAARTPAHSYLTALHTARNLGSSGPDSIAPANRCPRAGLTGNSSVATNAAEIDKALREKHLEFSVRFARSPDVGNNGINDRYTLCRLYTLSPRLRAHNRARLDFLFIFSPNRTYNRALPSYQYKMTVVSHYQATGLLQPGSLYTSNNNNNSSSSTVPASHRNISLTPRRVGNHDDRLSPLDNMHDLGTFQNDDTELLDPLSPSSSHLEPTSPEEGLVHLNARKSRAGSSGSPVPPRLKPIPKPDREVRKTRDGKYLCTATGCTDETKEFTRKCEWSKHMDKHDRPYKCPAEGCEKLPGFTYSGGLLRHEREVHGKHGGPKNPLNCPHVNCKRHDGKGFTRLENLNEHLRRVHTSSPLAPPGVDGEQADEDREDSASVTSSSGTGGRKRKASVVDDEVQTENKRLRLEVLSYQQRLQHLEDKQQALEREIAARNHMSVAMMDEIRQLRDRSQAKAPTPRTASFESGRLSGEANQLATESDDAIINVQHL